MTFCVVTELTFKPCNLLCLSACVQCVFTVDDDDDDGGGEGTGC